jgi:hypothetical protein
MLCTYMLSITLVQWSYSLTLFYDAAGEMQSKEYKVPHSGLTRNNELYYSSTIILADILYTYTYTSSYTQQLRR